MPCTEIRVLSLSKEASNRLGGVTDVLLDIPKSFSLRLSKDVERLSQLNKITTEGVLGFSVPATDVNDAIFLDYETPLTVNNRAHFYSVSVIVAGTPLNFNRLIVKQKSNNNSQWDLELRRSLDHWIELASHYTIDQIDFGTFPLNRDSVTTGWPAYKHRGGEFIRKTYWPVIDYGGWCDLTPVPQGATGNYKSVAVEDIRPLLAYNWLLQQGFCNIGWTLTGIIFDTDWSNRLWVYALRQDYYRASNKGGRITGRRFARKRWQNLTLDYLTFDELVEGLVPWQVPGDLAGIKNVPNVTLQYRFQMQGEFHNDRALPFTAVFAVFEVTGNDTLYQFTGEVLSESLIVEFEPNQKKMVLFDMVVTLKPGQMGAIHIGVTPDTDGFYIEKGLHVSITPDNKSLMTGDIVNVSECVYEYSLLDWFKAYVHLCNGRVETNWETRTVTIHPNKKSTVFGDVVPGFLLEEQPAEDISALIVANSVQPKPIRPDLKRYTRLEFASSTDAYIGSLNLTEPAHSRKLLNGIDLPDETEQEQNPLIEPTLEGVPVGIASGAGGRHPLPYLPRLWDNTDGNRSFAIGPRVLYAYGVIRQVNPAPVTAIDELTSFFFDQIPNNENDGLVEDFGYVSQLPTWDITPAPDIYPNVVYGSQPVDLFSIFRITMTQEARGGNIMDVLMFLSMTQYSDENFRTLKKFSYNGIPVRVPMIGIRDFASCSQIATPVTFFVPPVETECCDLPCGCQFTTCDYFQDFGVFMRAETLDDMRLASFVVDGIELIDTPLPFGTLKIVDVGGYQYVTNLVDLLNSVGAPYFSFGISVRTDPNKGKRFFSLKRPACTPFKILITNNGNEVYLYTNEEQKTKWFSGSTWEPFGYAGDTYDEPIDCVTLTEY